METKRYIKFTLSFFILLFATPSIAQVNTSLAKRVAHDINAQGYRLIEPYNTRVLTPKGSFKPISISLGYYQGFKNPFYIRLYSGYELSKRDELILILSQGKEIHLYAETSNIMHDRLGLIKERTIYDAIYILNEQQLSDVLSSTITEVKIGHGNKWNSKVFKRDEIGKWLKLNYRGIRRRLEKSR